MAHEDAIPKNSTNTLDSSQLLRIIESAILNPCRPVNLSHVITGLSPFDSAASITDIAWRNDPRFSPLQKTQAQRAFFRENSNPDTGANFKDSLLFAPNLADATAILTHALIHKLSEIFSLIPEEIDTRSPLSRYGVDSLVTMELRDWIITIMNAHVTLDDMLRSHNLNALVEKLAEKSFYIKDKVIAGSLSESKEI